jgi:RHS repeat-associated protein
VLVEKYLWQDLTTLLATYDGQGNLKQRFEHTLGHTPTSFTQGGQRYFIQTDHLGSPRVITDNSGAVVKSIRYDSYGNVIEDSNPTFEIPFGFAGGLYDADTGLVRFGFRDYDPEIGRWTARDPIGFGGGDVNLYGYVEENPVRFIDPKGLAKWTGRIESFSFGRYGYGGTKGQIIVKSECVGGKQWHVWAKYSGHGGSAGPLLSASASEGVQNSVSAN